MNYWLQLTTIDIEINDLTKANLFKLSLNDFHSIFVISKEEEVWYP